MEFFLLLFISISFGLGLALFYKCNEVNNLQKQIDQLLAERAVRIRDHPGVYPPIREDYDNDT